jgi:hypothetical protein
MRPYLKNNNNNNNKKTQKTAQKGLVEWFKV